MGICDTALTFNRWRCDNVALPTRNVKLFANFLTKALQPDNDFTVSCEKSTILTNNYGMQKEQPNIIQH